MPTGGQSGGGGTPRMFDEEAETEEVPRPPPAPPEPVDRRTPLPFWQALGKERDLEEGRKVWVIFADVIARIWLTGTWTVTRRGPRLIQELSAILHDPLEIYILTGDGVLCLQREALQIGEMAELHVDPEVIAGVCVEPLDEPEHDRTFIDLVRVSR